MAKALVALGRAVTAAAKSERSAMVFIVRAVRGAKRRRVKISRMLKSDCDLGCVKGAMESEKCLKVRQEGGGL